MMLNTSKDVWSRVVYNYNFTFYFSYWADPNKINNIDHIRAMEQSLKESLNRIQAHKVLKYLNSTSIAW